MDWENPLRSIAATVDADVLKVLAGAHEPVTGNQLAHLAGRSYAQVYAVVRRMVDEGLVLTARYGRTNTFRLNRDHALVQGILAVLAGPARLELEIKQLVQGWSLQPELVAMSGSAARRRTAANGEHRLSCGSVRPNQSGQSSVAQPDRCPGSTDRAHLRKPGSDTGNERVGARGCDIRRWDHRESAFE